MHKRTHQPKRTSRSPLAVLAAVVTVLAATLAIVGRASAGAPQTKTVSYRGYRVTVPASWPVYRLSATSTTCVRFNRHAVYLGQPGANQICPTAATGRTEAIAIAPLTGATDSSSAAAAALLTGTSLRLVNTAHKVVVTATWGSDPAVIERALGVAGRSALQRLANASRITPAPAASLRGASPARSVRSARVMGAKTAAAITAKSSTYSSNATAEPGEVYNGSGFDACSTPSSSVMSAWNSSPYRAIGVYIGGTNMACTQTNLTSSWVSAEATAGWHLIPIYVGLQAPGACSGCTAINPKQAASEGAQNAITAITEAQALGLGTGNPIYDDMESYSRTTANTTMVLAYLQAWSKELNSAGYLSGVYSSDYSGIHDLAAQAGTGYTEPNEIWFANWNGTASVTDSYALTSVWPAGERLHQYQGGFNATYGKHTLNIDADYLDAATAAAGGGATAAAALPTATSDPTVVGTPVAGQELHELHANWSNYPNSYSYQWQRCTRNLTTCTNISGATANRYVLTSADVNQRIKVVETAANPLGKGSAAGSAVTLATHRSASGILMYTSAGNVYNSVYEPFYGSPAAAGAKLSSSIVGMATTTDGYWLAARNGKVFHYGQAAALGTAAHSGVVGIAPAANGGFWLATAAGRVYNTANATWYGSLPARHIKTGSIVGIASTPDHLGYWLASSSGRVYAFGDARSVLGPRTVSQPVIGIVSSPRGGYWLYTSAGNVYRSRGNSWYGSMMTIPTAGGVPGSSGMVATADGRGYWLITPTGGIWSFGDAANYASPSVTSQIAGAA